ncbi:hypothetical protein TorRG33x02_312230, partial [Trema orientale]
MRKRYNRYYYSNLADVMTLGSPEWRPIRMVPSINYRNQPIFEKGFLYWLSDEQQNTQQLIAFNVDSEVFAIMETPSHVELIVDLGGYMGLVHQSSEGLKVWYGTNHNDQGQIIDWGEHDNIAIVHEGTSINPFELDLLGIWKNSTVLISWMRHPKVFFSYDFVSRSATVVEFPDTDLLEYKSFRGSSFSISEFHRSSCLPKGDDRQDSLKNIEDKKLKFERKLIVLFVALLGRW